MSKAELSSSDRKKNIILIGDSPSGELSLLDDKGSLYLYDGYRLKLWRESPLPNSQFITSLFLYDSIAYLLSDDALFSMSISETKPERLRVGKEQNLRFENNVLYYQAENQIWVLQDRKLKNTSRTATISNSSQFVTDDRYESFYVRKGQLLWGSLSGKVLGKLNDRNFEVIFKDQWNTMWAIAKGKLYSIEVNRSSAVSQEVNGMEEDAELVKVYSGVVYASTNNAIYKTSSPNASQLLCEYGNMKVKDFWIDQQDIVWVQRKGGSLACYRNSQWFIWTEQDLQVNDKIIGIDNHNGLISIVTMNSGILQSRIVKVLDDWIWVPHRLNNKLKNVGIIAFEKSEDRNLTYPRFILFTENFGLFEVGGSDIAIQTDGFPSYGISHVEIQGKNAVLLGKGKRWYMFTFGQAKRKSIKQLEFSVLPPEPISTDFIFEGTKVAYLSHDGLVIFNVENTSNIEVFPFQGTLEKAIVNDDFLVHRDGRKWYNFILPSAVAKRSEPNLVRVQAIDALGKSHDLDGNNSSTLHIESDQLPLEIVAFASYIIDPQSIEYALIDPVEKKSNRDFEFDKRIKWNPKAFDERGLELQLKIGAQQASHNLRKIKIRQSVVKEDYRWALYLSAALAAILLAAIIYFRIRSVKQKRKIETLTMQRRTAELEQKALQLQMNPHFIFNALNGVKGMIAMGDNQKARQYLTKTSGWIRRMLQDSRTDKTTIEDEVQNLSTYLEIEQELADHKWNYSIDLQAGVDSSWKIPPMIIQPFVENALVHAFKGMERKGEVCVTLVHKGRKIFVEVEDNGVGLQESSSRGHESIALKVISDRLKMMHSETKYQNFDLIDKKQLGGDGVLVRFFLPILD